MASTRMRSFLILVAAIAFSTNCAAAFSPKRYVVHIAQKDPLTPQVEFFTRDLVAPESRIPTYHGGFIAFTPDGPAPAGVRVSAAQGFGGGVLKISGHCDFREGSLTPPRSMSGTAQAGYYSEVKSATRVERLKVVIEVLCDRLQDVDPARYQAVVDEAVAAKAAAAERVRMEAEEKAQAEAALKEHRDSQARAEAEARASPLHHCDGCGHDYLLASSFKARYFCPSCHQKRMLACGE
jgi:rubrerythrin